MAEKKSKRTKDTGESEDSSDGGTVSELLRYFMEEKKEEKQRQEARDLQFLKIIEAITTKGQDEENKREERRREEDKMRDDRLAEERQMFVNRVQKEEEEKRAWLEQYEQEKRHWFEKMQASVPTGDSDPIRSGSQGKPREARLEKLTETDDIEHFLTMFERVATAYEWPGDVWVLKLATLLTGKAQAAYASMDPVKSKEFKEVKQAILKRYNINEETYRQRFRNTKKKPNESYLETEVRLKDLSMKWLKPNERSKDELVDVIIQEQLVNAMPRELQLRVRERKLPTAEQAGTIADDIIAARDSVFGGTNKTRRCLNCGKQGHLARDCRSTTKKDENMSSEAKDERKRGEPLPRRETSLTCFRCGKPGHIASRCPLMLPKGNGRNNAGNYFCDNAKNQVGTGPLFTSKLKEGEYVCQGLVEGKSTELLLDSGASCTLVHKDLVAEEKINTEDQLQIKCAHGDSVSYPTANIEININNKVYHVRAGVSSTLPRKVLLGRDIGNLLELAVREQEAFAVLTRIQKRKKEKEEATTLAKEITSGVKPRQLNLEDDDDDEAEDRVMLQQFDDSMFEGGQKRRKTKKEKRQEKESYRKTQTQNDERVSKPVEDSTSSEEVITNVEINNSTNVPEASNQENQGRSSAKILNINRNEFQSLQENDPTLESIRKVVAEKIPSNNTGKFFKQDGLLYRQWRPKDTDRDDPRAIEQLIVPAKCRKVALELAHDVPMSGHLGSKKKLDRLLSRFYWPGIIRDVSQHCKSCEVCQNQLDGKVYSKRI